MSELEKRANEAGCGYAGASGGNESAELGRRPARMLTFRPRKGV